MAVLAGTGGNVKVGTAIVAEIGDWSLDIDANSIDVSKFGTVWRQFITSIRGWSGTFAGRLDMTDTSGQLALQNALLGGTSVSLSLMTDTTGTHGYSGTAFLTKLSAKATATATVDGTFNFVGTGALTYA